MNRISVPETDLRLVRNFRQFIQFVCFSSDIGRVGLFTHCGSYFYVPLPAERQALEDLESWEELRDVL